MFSKLLLLGAFTASVYAQSIIDIPDSTLNSSQLKSDSFQLYRAGLGSQVSPLKWGECPSKHAYDLASGKSNPLSPVVGQEVALELDIIFNQEADVKGLKTEVMFNAQGASVPILLYS